MQSRDLTRRARLKLFILHHRDYRVQSCSRTKLIIQTLIMNSGLTCTYSTCIDIFMKLNAQEMRRARLYSSTLRQYHNYQTHVQFCFS